MERSKRILDLALQGLRRPSSSSSSTRKEYSIVKMLQLGFFKIVPSDELCITHTEGLHMTTHNGKDSWCIIFKQGDLHEMQTELETLNKFNALESQYKFMAYPSIETQTDSCNLSDKDIQTDEIPIPLLDLPVQLLNPIGELQSIETDDHMCGTYSLIPFSGNDELTGETTEQVHKNISDLVPAEKVEAHSFPSTQVLDDEFTGIDPGGSNQTVEEMEDLEEIGKEGILATQQETTIVGIDPDGSNQHVIDAGELEVTAGSETSVTAEGVPEEEDLLIQTKQSMLNTSVARKKSN